MQQIKDELLAFGCDPRLVERYMRVLSGAVYDPVEEVHHALPRAVFPEHEYTKWNLVGMSIKRHYVCHMLLYRMKKDCTSFQIAAWFMSNSRGVYTPARTYCELRRNNSIFAAKIMSTNMKGKATYKDDVGNTYHLSVDDPIIQDMGLKHMSCDTVVVNDGVDNSIKRISLWSII